MTNSSDLPAPLERFPSNVGEHQCRCVARKVQSGIVLSVYCSGADARQKAYLMSKARLLQDFLIPGNAENENTIIANYWLEFVSARDEREKAPVVRFTESDLRDRMREFQRQMSAVVRDHETLHKALAGEHFETPPRVPAMGGTPWGGHPDFSKVPGLNPPQDDSDDENTEYGSGDERPSLAPSPLSTLLLKILGK